VKYPYISLRQEYTIEKYKNIKIKIENNVWDQFYSIENIIRYSPWHLK
jgi:hypothetical protein